MKLIYLIIISSLFACTTTSKLYPLKGQYLDGPYQVQTTASKEVVWDKIIDLLAQKGLSIKIIDKSSGLITSERTHLLTSWEDKNGVIQSKDAFIVVPTYGKGSNYTQPGIVVGEWNIRIKEVEGKTNINVNVVNLKGSYKNLQGFTEEYTPIGAKSTGVFEKTIASMIL